MISHGSFDLHFSSSMYLFELRVSLGICPAVILLGHSIVLFLVF